MENLKKSLLEELARYNAINKYTKNLMEQGDVPLPDAPTDNPPATDEPTGEVTPTDNPLPEMPTEPVSDTEEVDVTDLVNMTKSIKKDLDDKKSENLDSVTKMDGLYTKLNDLEQKLSQMDIVLDKINQLGDKVENMREKTPQEKLELRSLDSYPFNLNPQEFFNQKQGEMQQSGKNEYVLTKQDIDNYSPDIIRNSFNAETEEEDGIKY